MNHSLYQDEILKALPFKRLPCTHDPKYRDVLMESRHFCLEDGQHGHVSCAPILCFNEVQAFLPGRSAVVAQFAERVVMTFQ
jgi:hypothetical protein